MAWECRSIGKYHYLSTAGCDEKIWSKVFIQGFLFVFVMGLLSVCGATRQARSVEQACFQVMRIRRCGKAKMMKLSWDIPYLHRLP